MIAKLHRFARLRGLTPAALLLAQLARAPSANAQDAAARSTGHPARIATEASIADVHAFAVARAGDRAIVAYVQGEDPRERGAVRTAMLHALPASAGLERTRDDRTVAPLGFAVALSWNGERGAVAFTVPRPHRGEAPGTHRQRAGSTERALANPLGSSALTAADIVLQPIDADGLPVGRAVVVFEENSRAYQVAVAPDGDGWLIAWTGAVTLDAEIQGTVRYSRVSRTGVARSFASDTGFTGHTGEVLRIASASDGNPSATVLWSGQRCRAQEGESARAQPTVDPTDAAGIHPGALRSQHLPNEHNGPPIECGPTRVFAIETHADGTSGPISEGPVLATDAFAVIAERSRMPAVIAPIRGERAATLGFVSLRPHAAFDDVRTLVDPPAPVESASPTPHGDDDDTSNNATLITPSRVSPPRSPGADGIATAPVSLDAALVDGTLSFVALSPTRARIALGTTRPSEGPTVALTLLAPHPLGMDVAIAAIAGRPPWLFVHTGGIARGMLQWIDAGAPGFAAAPPETPWPGDERFRQHLLRARAARGAYFGLYGVFGPVNERPDSATNPRLPPMAAELRRLRSHWESACEPLNERARFLARHGVEATIVELAREQCELPPEAIPGVPAPPGP